MSLLQHKILPVEAYLTTQTTPWTTSGFDSSFPLNTQALVKFNPSSLGGGDAAESSPPPNITELAAASVTDRHNDEAAAAETDAESLVWAGAGVALVCVLSHHT